MQNIRGIEKIEQVIGHWCPRDLAFIKALELRKGPCSGYINLVIQALFQPRSGGSWPDFEKEMFRVTIQFEDVGDFRLKDFGGLAVQIMGFDIDVVRDRGLERTTYKVVDYEDNRISFDCSNISIQSVELAVDERL